MKREGESPASSLSSSGSSRSSEEESEESEEEKESYLSSEEEVSPSASPLSFFNEDDGGVRSSFMSVGQRFMMDRVQRCRRLTSQRKLGTPAPLNSFLMRRKMIADDDAGMLMTFSNADYFYRLLDQVKESGGGKPMEQLLSHANPYFYYMCGVQADCSDVSALVQDEQLTEIPASENPSIRNGVRQAMLQPIYREAVIKAPAKTKEAKGSKGSTSGASGMMKKSMEEWERHLSEELRNEGETVENFRRHTTKNSLLEKQEFKEKAAWNEYTRELEIQEKQRKIIERKRKRSAV